MACKKMQAHNACKKMKARKMQRDEGTQVRKANEYVKQVGT